MCVCVCENSAIECVGLVTATTLRIFTIKCRDIHIFLSPVSVALKVFLYSVVT